MNNTTPKRHAETPQNKNIPFQLKKQNTYQNEIDNLAANRQVNSIIYLYIFFLLLVLKYLFLNSYPPTPRSHIL